MGLLNELHEFVAVERLAGDRQDPRVGSIRCEGGFRRPTPDHPVQSKRVLVQYKLASADLGNARESARGGDEALERIGDLRDLRDLDHAADDCEALFLERSPDPHVREFYPARTSCTVRPMTPAPVAAALASLVWPGLGQIWLGQPAKGALVAGLGVVTCLGAGLLPLFAAWDAWVLADRRRAEGRALDPWEAAGPLKAAGDAAVFCAELVTTIF